MPPPPPPPPGKIKQQAGLLTSHMKFSFLTPLLSQANGHEKHRHTNEQEKNRDNKIWAVPSFLPPSLAKSPPLPPVPPAPPPPLFPNKSHSPFTSPTPCDCFPRDLFRPFIRCLPRQAPDPLSSCPPPPPPPQQPTHTRGQHWHAWI